MDYRDNYTICESDSQILCYNNTMYNNIQPIYHGISISGVLEATGAREADIEESCYG